MWHCSSSGSLELKYTQLGWPGHMVLVYPPPIKSELLSSRGDKANVFWGLHRWQRHGLWLRLCGMLVSEKQHTAGAPVYLSSPQAPGRWCDKNKEDEGFKLCLDWKATPYWLPLITTLIGWVFQGSGRTKCCTKSTNHQSGHLTKLLVKLSFAAAKKLSSSIPMTPRERSMPAVYSQKELSLGFQMSYALDIPFF